MTHPLQSLRGCSLLIAAMLLGACAPKLVIRHNAPEHSFVQVRIDEEERGFVEPGTTWRTRVSSGYHRVETIPRGASDNPWAEDGEGWTLFIERKTELTLLPQP